MSSMPENVDDRLSMLPEEIISQVLSLMPTKFAVRTSILSMRWRYAWTSSITNLDFDYTRRRPRFQYFVDGNEESFTQFVDRVFSFCKTHHLKLLRLHVSNHLVHSSSISNWVDNAVRLNVRELDICVLQYELPLSVFTCNTLTNLRLQLGICDFNGWELPSRIHLPCLKALDLARYSGFPRTTFELIISGCPVLESLSLELLCHDEEDCMINIPTLKRLKLLYRSASDSVNNKVVLRVPKLEYLLLGGILGSLFVMEDASSLVEASIVCWTSTRDYLWADLLNQIRLVQNLSIVNKFPFTSPLPIFPNLKQLELNGLWKSGQITHFLKSCPELKIFCIDSVDWRVFKVKTKTKQKSEESSWIDFDPKFIPACMLANLTTIKFSKCEGDESDIAFLEYMLGNSQVLKAVTVFALEKLLVAEDPWFCAHVLRIPRSSQHSEIHFRPWKLPPSQEYERPRCQARIL